MTWKAIGQSVIGTSHTTTGINCQDAVNHSVITSTDGTEILLVTISDGAGSALYAAEAAQMVTSMATEYIKELLQKNNIISATHIYALAEHLYDQLAQAASSNEVTIDEYSCTMLGAIIGQQNAVFYQIGDGAIIRTDDSGTYNTIWWPHNGEYLNTTAFVTDHLSMPSLQVVVLQEKINEIALLTDGLQMLTLSMDTMTVHQPFFKGFFHHLRMADTAEKTELLDTMLAKYLDSTAINARTDDDKTLFLATRLPA
jgi:hypothetical protein